MDFNLIAKRAYERTGIEENYKLEEKYAYSQLVDLYVDYAMQHLTKEECIEKKTKIEKEYNENVKQRDLISEMFKEYNKRRIENETLLAKIEKSTDKEEIMQSALTIIQNCVNDSQFFDRNMQKIENLDLK